MVRTIEARGLTVALGGQTILERVDFQAKPGELVGLVGPNGAGKTTLLRTLAGLLAPREGEVLLDGRAIEGISRRELAQALAYLPQDHTVHWSITVEDLVTLGRLPHRRIGAPRGAADLSATKGAIAAMDLGALSSRPVTELSGGELARALIGRALAQEAPVLLADEPAAGLDAAHQLELFAHFGALAEARRTVVIVLHDLSMAMRFCDRIVVLNKGRVHASGPPSKTLTARILEEVYSITAYRGSIKGIDYIVPLEGVRYENGRDRTGSRRRPKRP